MTNIFNMYDSINSSINLNIIFNLVNNINLNQNFNMVYTPINISLVIKTILYIYIITFIATFPLFNSIDIITQSMSEDDLSSIQDLLIMVVFTVSIFISYMTFFTGFFFF